jgi:hypothetical protein
MTIRSRSSALVLLLALFSLPLLAPLRAAPSKPAPCASPEHRQLDFWLGDWDAFDVDDKGGVGREVSARLKVDLLLDGCVLREDYQGMDGLKGESFTIYDAARKLWHQTWVTNRGQLLTIEGRREEALEGEPIVLEGEIPGADGKPAQRIRGLWKRQGEGVRETALTSADGGKSWQPLFDILFRPHHPTKRR